MEVRRLRLRWRRRRRPWEEEEEEEGSVLVVGSWAGAVHGARGGSDRRR
jgi:hypothetical protein